VNFAGVTEHPTSRSTASFSPHVRAKKLSPDRRPPVRSARPRCRHLDLDRAEREELPVRGMVGRYARPGAKAARPRSMHAEITKAVRSADVSQKFSSSSSTRAPDQLAEAFARLFRRSSRSAGSGDQA